MGFGNLFMFPESYEKRKSVQKLVRTQFNGEGRCLVEYQASALGRQDVLMMVTMKVLN